MNLNMFLNEKRNTAAENRLLKFVVAVIGAMVLVNTVMLYRALGSYRTILVPPVINTKLEIFGDKVSEEYVRVMARYISSLVANYTPATARGQFDEMLSLYAPEYYAAAKKEFYLLAESVESAKVANVFQLQKISIDPGKVAIELQGVKTQYMNDQKMKESNETYVIEYKVSDGRFMVKRIYTKASVEGGR